ncbi:hypothetical protein CSPAE12_06038, partial [Colletotrichum incanum]
TPTKRRRVVLPPFGVPSPSRRSGSSSPYKQGRNAALGIIRTISYDATKRSISDYNRGIGVISLSEQVGYSSPEFPLCLLTVVFVQAVVKDAINRIPEF